MSEMAFLLLGLIVLVTVYIMINITSFIREMLDWKIMRYVNLAFLYAIVIYMCHMVKQMG